MYQCRARVGAAGRPSGPEYNTVLRQVPRIRAATLRATSLGMLFAWVQKLECNFVRKASGSERTPCAEIYSHAGGRDLNDASADGWQPEALCGFVLGGQIWGYGAALRTHTVTPSHGKVVGLHRPRQVSLWPRLDLDDLDGCEDVSLLEESAPVHLAVRPPPGTLSSSMKVCTLASSRSLGSGRWMTFMGTT